MTNLNHSSTRSSLARFFCAAAGVETVDQLIDSAAAAWREISSDATLNAMAALGVTGLANKLANFGGNGKRAAWKTIEKIGVCARVFAQRMDVTTAPSARYWNVTKYMLMAALCAELLDSDTVANDDIYTTYGRDDARLNGLIERITKRDGSEKALSMLRMRAGTIATQRPTACYSLQFFGGCTNNGREQNVTFHRDSVAYDCCMVALGLRK